VGVLGGKLPGRRRRKGGWSCATDESGGARGSGGAPGCGESGGGGGGRRRHHAHVARVAHDHTRSRALVVLVLVVVQVAVLQVAQQGGRDALEHPERRRLLLVEALCAVARAEALEELAERALDHRDLLEQDVDLRFLLRESRRREVQRAGDLGVRVREGFEVGGEGVRVHGRALDGDARAAASPEALHREHAERVPPRVVDVAHGRVTTETTQ